jgi:hypothetical protein
MLVREVGVNETARRMNIPLGTVKAWSAREGWLADKHDLAAALATATGPAAATVALQLPATMRPLQPRGSEAGATIATASGVLADVNAENGARSRSAALRYSARNLEHLADLPAEEGVFLAPQAASLVKVAATAGDWASSQRGSVRINILAADPFSQVQIEADK